MRGLFSGQRTILAEVVHLLSDAVYYTTRSLDLPKTGSL